MQVKGSIDCQTEDQKQVGDYPMGLSPKINRTALPEERDYCPLTSSTGAEGNSPFPQPRLYWDSGQAAQKLVAYLLYNDANQAGASLVDDALDGFLHL